MMLTGGFYKGYSVFFMGVILISSTVGLEIMHYEYMFCPHCGRYLYKNYGDYCQKCGHLIEWKNE